MRGKCYLPCISYEMLVASAYNLVRFAHEHAVSHLLFGKGHEGVIVFVLVARRLFVQRSVLIQLSRSPTINYSSMSSL